MKIVIISDTHSKHRSLTIPEADVIICCGDITYRGELNIIEDFANWMKELPVKHRVVIFGNHETGMSNGYKRKIALDMLAKNNITYLEDSEVIIDGIKFYGSPVTPRFFDWEWNKNRGPEINQYWDLIPDNTNVLITHGPPKNILDEILNKDRVGCEDLAKKILELKKLKLHCFGHLHLNGNTTVDVDGVKFVNAAICDDSYMPNRPPVIVEI